MTPARVNGRTRDGQTSPWPMAKRVHGVARQGSQRVKYSCSPRCRTGSRRVRSVFYYNPRRQGGRIPAGRRCASGGRKRPTPAPQRPGSDFRAASNPFGQRASHRRVCCATFVLPRCPLSESNSIPARPTMSTSLSCLFPIQGPLRLAACCSSNCAAPPNPVAAVAASHGRAHGKAVRELRGPFLRGSGR